MRTHIRQSKHTKDSNISNPTHIRQSDDTEASQIPTPTHISDSQTTCKAIKFQTPPIYQTVKTHMRQSNSENPTQKTVKPREDARRHRDRSACKEAAGSRPVARPGLVRARPKKCSGHVLVVDKIAHSPVHYPPRGPHTGRENWDPSI